jgi:hypothetical protein
MMELSRLSEVSTRSRCGVPTTTAMRNKFKDGKEGETSKDEKQEENAGETLRSVFGFRKFVKLDRFVIRHTESQTI